MKPGLISSATLAYLNEDDLLSKEVDANEFYLTNIWPKKVQMNVDYVQNWRLSSDLKIIVQFLRLLLK